MLMSDKGGPIQSRDDNPTRKKPLETLEEVFLKLEAKVSGRKLSAAFVESSLSKEFAASLRSSRCPFPSAHSCYETRVVVRKSNGERSRRGRKLVVDYGYSTVPVHVPLDARTLEIGGQWPLCSFFLSLNNSFGFSLKGQLTVRKTFFDDEKNNVFAPAAPTSSSDQKLSARLRVRNFHFPTPDDNETFLRIIEDYQATGHNDCKLVKPSFDRCLLRTTSNVFNSQVLSLSLSRDRVAQTQHACQLEIRGNLFSFIVWTRKLFPFVFFLEKFPTIVPENVKVSKESTPSSRSGLKSVI